MDALPWIITPALAEGRRPAAGHPLVHVSYAQSIDGRIATRSGDSRGLSSAESLNLTHQIRAESDAILVGVGTVLADDPSLDCRLPETCAEPARRIILDSRLRLPLDSRVVRTARRQPTLVFCVRPAVDDHDMRSRLEALEAAGVEVVPADPGTDGRIDPGRLLDDLGKRGCRALFVEGGSAVLTAFAAAGLVDLYTIFFCPCLIGSGIEAFASLGNHLLADCPRLQAIWSRAAGPDLVWRLRPA